MIPLVIENHRRREKDITLQLSNWKTISGKATVQTLDLTPATFELKPCSEQTVQLKVSIECPPEHEGPCDVECCSVSVADLDVEGCDLKRRIAVAALPMACSAFEMDCRCSCCC